MRTDEVEKSHLLYLSRKDLEEVNLPLEDMLSVMERSFVAKGKGDAIMEPKHWYDWGNNRFFSAMSAYVPAFGVAGVKWQGGVPDNPSRNLPYISGYLILSELKNGMPITIMDSTWLTGVRTGVQTGLTAKYLALKNAETFAILGCGVQGRTNLNALMLVLKNLKRVQAFDINIKNLEAYVEWVKTLGLEAIPCTNPKNAISGADIIVTAGPIHENPSDDINPEWLKEGVLAVPLDYDSYWNTRAINSFDKFFVDDVSQVMHYKNQGNFFRNIPEIDSHLADIVIGKDPGRTSNSQKIMCMNLGIATEDMAIAIAIFNRAVEKGIGTWIRR